MDGGGTGLGPTSEAQKATLQRARDLAATGNLDGMMAALHSSYILDGLLTSIKRQWRFLSHEDAQDAVAEAVKVLYEKLRTGGTVPNIAGFLVKVAQNKASDRNRHQDVERTIPPEAFGATLNRRGSLGVAPEYSGGTDGLDRELARREALMHARRLLPRLGQANIQSVMTMVLDAVEQGLDDLSPTLIGETLGITDNYATILRNRGFQRLERLAREEGLWDADLSVLGFVEEGGDHDFEMASADDEEAIIE